MMHWLLLESALRSLVLGAIVWFGLKLLRVRNPQLELTAWTVVLAAALAMPMLMRVITVTVPAPLPVSASVTEILSATPSLAPDAPSLAAVLPTVAPPTSLSFPVDWQAIAAGVYFAVAGVLILRLLIGVAMIWRLSRSAQPIREIWTNGSDVRAGEVGMPVTFGGIILLPPDYAGWPAIKRQAVLAHESAHVARGDYWVLLLAALHRAVFWFSPLSWWLLNRLAALMEAASDDAAIADLRDRTAYAEVLVDIAQRTGGRPIGVAMARPATVAGRVDRILRNTTIPVKIGLRSRALVAASLLPIVAIAAAGVARSGPVGDLSGMEAANMVRLDAFLPISLASLQIDPLETLHVLPHISPVALKMPAVLRSEPIAPAQAVAATSVAAQAPPAASAVSPPAGATAPKDGISTTPTDAQPIDLTGTWISIKGGPPSCTFQQTANQLSGFCKALFFAGPVKGSIEGRTITWRWLYRAGGIASVHDWDVEEFKATLLPNNRIEGSFYGYKTFDKFNPSFEYKTSHLIPRPPGRYFLLGRQS